MDQVNPIMVGRNAPAQPAVAQPAQAPVNPLQQQMAALAQAQTPEVAAAAPAPVAVAPLQAPVAQAPVQTHIQQAGGCALYFNVKAVTKIVLEMPWGFINNELDCAFISNMGELVVCDLPPMYDEVNDVFVLDVTAKSLVLGAVADEHRVHWRESVSFRPDSGYSDDDVHTVKHEEPTVETPVAPAAKLVDNTDYSHLSRNQRKRLKKKKLASGTNLEDLPESLRNA